MDNDILLARTQDVRSPIVGSGEMAKRIRAFSWDRTPLGSIDQWSPTLVNTVNMALAVNFPVQLLWGPEFIIIHNDGWIPLLMDREQQALGQSGTIFWSEVWHLVTNELHGVLERGISTSRRNILLPILRSGAVCNVYWDYTYNPVYEPDGTIVAVLNISQDVTDAHMADQKRRTAEEALHNSQAELRKSVEALHAERQRLLSVLQQAPIFFALLQGPEHEFTMVNALYTRLIGRDVLGKRVAEVIPEARDQGYLQLLDTVLATGEPFVAFGASINLLRDESKGLEERIMDFMYQPMRETSGEVSGIIAIGVDITERRRAETALVQNEKLAVVGRLAASIAHEINNPLEAVTNLLYLARNDDSLDAIKSYLSIADEELRRAAAITSHTLRFHKQASSAEEIEPETVMDGVLSIYRGRLTNAKVQLESRMRATRKVRCFEGEIRQVLSNLIGNAVDAMAGLGGRLLVRSRNSTDPRSHEIGLTITVADTGSGMSATTRVKLFEPFFTTKGMSGNGLGLWISKEIVERHSGRLAVRSSQRAGHAGTVFTLFLPMGKEPVPASGSVDTLKPHNK